MAEQLKVLVSNPLRQHTHHLCYGLQQAGLLGGFYTTIWYKPQIGWQAMMEKLPARLLRPWHKLMRKRYASFLQPDKVHTRPWGELFRQFQARVHGQNDERFTFTMEQAHDMFMARQILKEKPDVVIGYEKSCFHTFTAAKKIGAYCILDLAQVHVDHISALAEAYPMFRSIQTDDRTLAEIQHQKRSEYELADTIFALSEYAAGTLLDGGIPQEKIQITHLGCDTQRFVPSSKNNDDKPFRFLFVGTMTKRKGLHLLLEAWERLNLRDAELHLVGPMADAIDLIQNGLPAKVQHHPFMHHEELVKLYQAADCFVFPSYLDSWAMVVVEAMACGIPVIVSDHTGAKDVVIKGGGKIISHNSGKELEQAMLFMYQNPAQAKVWGKEAADLSKQYTWEHYYQQIGDLVPSLWKRNKQGSQFNRIS
ncbi:MAG: glycosyltransferase family 4 protein, partial [Bacteroidota bacterium]